MGIFNYLLSFLNHNSEVRHRCKLFVAFTHLAIRSPESRERAIKGASVEVAGATDVVGLQLVVGQVPVTAVRP